MSVGLEALDADPLLTWLGGNASRTAGDPVAWGACAPMRVPDVAALVLHGRSGFTGAAVHVSIAVVALQAAPPAPALRLACGASSALHGVALEWQLQPPSENPGDAQGAAHGRSLAVALDVTWRM